MIHAPRPYQAECYDAIEANYHAGVTRQLVVLPTAGGKTVIVARIPKLVKLQDMQQVVFIVPLDELVWQAQETFRAFNPHLTVGVVKAEHNDTNSDVLIASAQTIGYQKNGIYPRLKQINPNWVRAVGIDECHRSTAAMYQEICRHLRVLKGDPGEDKTRLLVGVTATPNRTDGVGLEAMFEKITYEDAPIGRLMKEGPVIEGKVYSYLAKPKVYRFSTNVDVSKAKTKKSGDFSDTDLSHILDSPERNRMIVRGYLDKGEGFPGVTFSCDVKHAYHLAEEYEAAGVPAAVIDGKTSRDKRDQISERYQAGEIRMICSCQAVVEGWDEPSATVAVMARPHSEKSTLTITQKLGRVFRPSPSPEKYIDMLNRGERPKWVKPYSIVLDFVDVMGKHELSSVNSLFGLPPKYNCHGKDVFEAVKEVEAVVKKHSIKDFKHATCITDLVAQAELLDIFAVPEPSEEARSLSKLSWLELREGVLQLDIGAGHLEVRVSTLGDTEIYHSRNGLRTLLGKRMTLAEGLAFADSHVPREQLTLLLTDSRWRGHPPSEPQCKLLWKNSPEARKKFKKHEDLYKFAAGEFKRGDKRYGKGGLSKMIDRTLLEKVG